MSSAEYRSRYESVLTKYQDLVDFVEGSVHSDDDEIVDILNRLSSTLDTLDRDIEEYEAWEERLERESERVETAITKFEGFEELFTDIDPDLRQEAERARESFEEDEEWVEEARMDMKQLGSELEATLNKAETACDALGKKLASTSEYDPTTASGIDDPTEQAELDAILRDISDENLSDL